MEIIYAPCKNTLLYIGYLKTFLVKVQVKYSKTNFALFQVVDFLCKAQTDVNIMNVSNS